MCRKEDTHGSWDLIYHALRANFDGTSSDYLLSAEDRGSARYEYGCTVTGIKVDDNAEEGTVTVEYTDRDKQTRTLKSERVFAADGPSSTIRGILLPDVKRTYAGYVPPLVPSPQLFKDCSTPHGRTESDGRLRGGVQCWRL